MATDSTLDAGAQTRSAVSGTTLSGSIVALAARDALAKLDPRHLTGNPVILAT